MRGCAEAVLGTRTFEYQGRDYDFGEPFRRVTVEQS